MGGLTMASKHVLDTNLDFRFTLSFIEAKQYRQAFTAFSNLGYTGRADFIQALHDAKYYESACIISKLWASNSKELTA